MHARPASLRPAIDRREAGKALIILADLDLGEPDPSPLPLPCKERGVAALDRHLELAQDKVGARSGDPAAGQSLVPEHLQPDRRDPFERRRNRHGVGVPDRQRAGDEHRAIGLDRHRRAAGRKRLCRRDRRPDGYFVHVRLPRG